MIDAWTGVDRVSERERVLGGQTGLTESTLAELRVYVLDLASSFIRPSVF